MAIINFDYKTPARRRRDLADEIASMEAQARVRGESDEAQLRRREAVAQRDRERIAAAVGGFLPPELQGRAMDVINANLPELQGALTAASRLPNISGDENRRVSRDEAAANAEITGNQNVAERNAYLRPFLADVVESGADADVRGNLNRGLKAHNEILAQQTAQPFIVPTVTQQAINTLGEAQNTSEDLADATALRPSKREATRAELQETARVAPARANVLTKMFDDAYSGAITNLTSVGPGGLRMAVPRTDDNASWTPPGQEVPVNPLLLEFQKIMQRQAAQPDRPRTNY